MHVNNLYMTCRYMFLHLVHNRQPLVLRAGWYAKHDGNPLVLHEQLTIHYKGKCGVILHLELIWWQSSSGSGPGGTNAELWDTLDKGCLCYSIRGSGAYLHHMLCFHRASSAYLKALCVLLPLRPALQQLDNFFCQACVCSARTCT